MNRLRKIARSAVPGADVCFRRDAYGKRGMRHFLRDVLAMANADVDGSRYLVVGAEFNERNQKRIFGVDKTDFDGDPPYAKLVAEFIEPAVRITYQAVPLDGKTVGVFEIANCHDKPYMMRIDQSEKLRRGDAYTRVGVNAVKMGRRQLQELFEQKFQNSVPDDCVEIGFPGEIIHKHVRLPTTDMSSLPSSIAGAKLKEMLDVKQQSNNNGSTTMMARLTHARLFGADAPYENRSAEDLLEELEQIERKHRLDDEHYLFEQHAERLQLVVVNQGIETIADASLSLILPTHTEFHVANQLPKTPRNGKFLDRSALEQSAYPSVNTKSDSIHVTSSLGELPAHVPVSVFEAPLRMCIGPGLRGRKMGIRYALSGSNMRRPAKGKLRLSFA